MTPRGKALTAFPALPSRSDFPCRGRIRVCGTGSAPGAKSSERNVYASERFAGKFRRVIALPEDAEPSRVEATYRNGVLKVVVPKRESSKPRQIPVSSDR